MKKIFKSRIFAFILGALIFSGITAVSAYTIFANDIGYTPKDTTWKKSNGEDITNVKDAIDELYSKANNKNIVFSHEDSQSSLGSWENRNISSKLDSGKYLVTAVVSYVTTPPSYSSTFESISIDLLCDKNCEINNLFSNNYNARATSAWNGAYVTDNFAIFQYNVLLKEDDTTISYSHNRSATNLVPHGIVLEAVKVG